MTLALLLTAVTGAWADWTGGTYTATADENLGNIIVSDDVTLTINAGVTVTVTSYNVSAPGIKVANGKTLTIVGPGTLVVNGAAGNDGGNYGDDAGNAIMGAVVIYGGTITATGGKGGYGTISSGHGGAAFAGRDATLTYYGGTVNANGGDGGGSSSEKHGQAFASSVTVTWMSEPTSGRPSNFNQQYVSFSDYSDGPEVTWDATKKKGTFTMPDYNVVLTPIYAAATVYGSDGQTEKSAYASLKEAFLAAQNGDIIKLDGDVTVTSATDLMTSNRATEDPVQFTIDFNGHVLDGSSVATTFMNTEHDGDQITFIDSSTGEVGGLKGMVSGKKNSFVFASGRYSFKDMTAAEIESQWSTSLAANGWAMAEGKKFVDLEGAPDANGFMVGIGLADYDISFRAANANTIESGKASVTIDGAAATLTEGKVTGVKMGQQVKMTAAQGYKFRKVEAKKGKPVAEAITVVWVSSDLTGSGNTFTKDGVTITAGNIDYSQKNFENGGTFTTTLGNFTKIEIRATWPQPSGEGWSGSNWTGNASSVEFSGDISDYSFGTLRVVFTILPTN